MKEILMILILFFLSLYCFTAEYTVVKGDCLWNIAKRFYHNPFLWKKIYEVNKHQIKDPDLIYPGQIFILPDIETISETLEEDLEETKEKVTEIQDILSQEASKIIEESVEDEVVEEQIEEKSLEEKGIEDILSEKREDIDKEKVVKFPNIIKLKDFEIEGEIIYGMKEKFMYIDFDKVYCELKEDVNVSIGEVLGIYHLGPSKYDINLMKAPKDQLTLVGKARVIKILEDRKILCEIIRTYSPIVIGDFIYTSKK
ncbi:MAG: LysM peptidoglycan-binding domain-containing protein [Elusimicrobiota bacterium]|nr:LysM peptidoglycan-binding domain-containing protein [Endomicrobiia bacterium]MDW8165519.1 LysM peptidoglycan-binding domain-containing protein [Elusimicrobiota bacterium]